jgi:hypothetical protein
MRSLRTRILLFVNTLLETPTVLFVQLLERICDIDNKSGAPAFRVGTDQLIIVLLADYTMKHNLVDTKTG